VPRSLGRSRVLNESANAPAPSRCSIAANSDIPASDVIRPPSKATRIRLTITDGKPGKIPVFGRKWDQSAVNRLFAGGC
jgi:hypothetical protein